MRYWKLKESNRVIAVHKECEMTPRWLEITKLEFDVLVLLRGQDEKIYV